MKAKMTVYKNGGKTPIVPDPKKKMTDMEIAKANRMDMLTQERNTIRKYDPAALPAFDRGLKEQGFMVNKKPAAKPAAAAVKKMMGGGKMDMMYGMGGKIKKYLMGGQVKIDKNKDGKISAIDFKMLKKK